jgi:hypothetical protein
MVIAIAALFLQITPAIHPLPQLTDLTDSPAETATFAINRPDASPNIANVSGTLAALPAQPAMSATANGEAQPFVSQPAAPNTGIEASESLSIIRIPEKGAKDNRFIPLETSPSRRNWIALSAAQHAAAAFDAYTTRDAISRGAGEMDPLMRPFANSSAIYAAIQVAPAALDFAARRMQRSPNNFLRHTWWLPQSLSTGMFLFSGVHNLHVAGRM